MIVVPLIVSLSVAGPVRGGERRVAVRDLQQGPYAGDPGTAALHCLADLGALPAGARSTLEVVDVRASGRATTVRLGQRLSGLPVLGGYAVVRLDPQGHATLVNGALFDGLGPVGSATLSPADALAVALAAVAAPAAARTSDPSLAVLPDGEAGALVYDLRIFAEAPLTSLRVLVDARRGEVVRVEDRIVAAWGSVYQTSPAHGDPVEVELAELPVGATVLDGERVVARSVTSGNSLLSAQHLAVADEQGDFLFDPEEPSIDDEFAEVNAYHHVIRGARYFEEQHGHALDSRIAVYTNFFLSQPNDCPNAYYAQDPQGTDLLIYGQGDVDFGYDGDVVLHEFGHLINHDLAPLEMEYFFYDEFGWFVGPSAIDEGLADYWSATLQDSATHAEYSSGSLGLDRELDNDRTCPADAIGESHHDGQIVSGAAWELREILGAEITDALMYDALSVQGGRPTFADLAGAISAIAGEMADAGELTADQRAEVDAVLDDRGLLGCGRAVPLADGETTELNLGLFYWLSGLVWKNECRSLQDTDTRFGAYFQLAVTTPPADAGELLGLEIDLRAEAADGDPLHDLDLDYTVFLRRDELVTFEMVETGNTTLFPYSGSGPMPAALEYELAVDGSPERIELTPDGELSLEPDTTYYLAVSHMNCEELALAVTPRFVFAEVEELGGGEDGGGCECHQAPSGAGPIGAWLGLLAAAGARVRSRTRRG